MTHPQPALKRIGVFGGAFDPPHLAHVALARAAVAQLQLDKLLIIPTGQAWHKARALTAAHHRMEMVKLAFADIAEAEVDSREVLRSGASYTVDTLREINAQWPQAEVFLLIGEDQARALPTWQKISEILQLAIICVAEREDLVGASSKFVAPQAQTSRFKRLHLPAMTVSATDIRDRIATHQSVNSLVMEPVARYIEHHHLYQTH